MLYIHSTAYIQYSTATDLLDIPRQTTCTCMNPVRIVYRLIKFPSTYMYIVYSFIRVGCLGISNK